MTLRRFHKIAWFCTLLLLVQLLLPASAVALVSIRCAGAPASAPACARAVLPMADSAMMGTYRAAKACCLHMNGLHCAMMGGRQAVPSAQATVQADLPCIVSISVFASDRPASAGSLRERTPPSAPVLLSAAAQSVLHVLSPIVTADHASPFALPPACTAQAHGLRAPPVS